MERVIITGATSFIGLIFIKMALEKGLEVVAVVRPNTRKRSLLPSSPLLTVVETGMEDYSALPQLVARPCDVFFHLAWNGTRGAERMDEQMQSFSYRSSLAAALSARALGCRLFISAGSQAEYGNSCGPIGEDAICRPNTEYGKYKLRLYEELREQSAFYGFHFKEPRFFSLYGPRDFEQTLVISTLKKMLANEPCDLTACVQNWDFLYIDDAVRGVFLLMEQECADGAYNFGSGISQSLKEYVQVMAKLTQTESILRFGAIPYPATGMVSLEPVVKKLKSETGWRPQVSFQEGILKIITEMRKTGAKH